MMVCRSGAPRVSAWGMHSHAPQEGTTFCWMTKGCSASPMNAGPCCKRNKVSHTTMTTPAICTTDLLDIHSYQHDKRAGRAPCRWTRHKCANKVVESRTHSGIWREGGQICTCTVKQGWAELKTANLQHVQPTHAPTRGKPDVSRAHKMQCLASEPTSGHCEGYARRERLTQQRVLQARNTLTTLCTGWCRHWGELQQALPRGRLPRQPLIKGVTASDNPTQPIRTHSRWVTSIRVLHVRGDSDSRGLRFTRTHLQTRQSVWYGGFPYATAASCHPIQADYPTSSTTSARHHAEASRATEHRSVRLPSGNYACIYMSFNFEWHINT